MNPRPELATLGVLDLKSFVDFLLHRGVEIQDVVDGGACVGDAAHLLAEAANGRVFSYEPFESNIRRFRHLETVELRPFALGRHSGKRSFAVPRSGANAGEEPLGYLLAGPFSRAKMYVGKYLRRQMIDRVWVDVVSLEEDLPSSAQVSLVKLDIQGGEVPALLGFGSGLADVGLMWIEYTGSQPGLLRLLRRSGFEVFETAYLFEVGRKLPKTFRTLDEIVEASHYRRVRATRTANWRWFGLQFQALKRFRGLIQTDLICLRRDLLSEIDL